MTIIEDKFPDIETDPYDGFLHRTYDEAVDIATAKGLVVRAPGPRELFIDIDSNSQYETFQSQLNAMPRGLVYSWSQSKSPSGDAGHWHVVVTLSRDISSDLERILLQSLLGSDPMRELLSWRRVEDGSDSDAVSLFFEKPGWDAPVRALPAMQEPSCE